MQFEPDAPTLLAAIARLLDEQVLGAVPSELAHQVRVAAHLANLLGREARLGAGAKARERELLTELLRATFDDIDETEDLAAALSERLRAVDDPDLERRAWPVLVEIARLDLAVAKPGHDAWEGQ